MSFAERARAQLLVMATPGEPPSVAHAELAYAAGSGPPVTWLSLRVARGPVAVVAALPPAATAEAGLDSWFSALEATASPNVLLPLRGTNCGRTSSFVHVAWPRAAGVPAAELSLTSADDVASALDEQGLTLRAELPPAERYLLWSWPAADEPQTTRTLRIQGGAAPLGLLPSSGFPLLVSSVTRGALALPTELLNGELAVTFVANQRPGTDYIERLQDWLSARPEPLLETRARGPLFDWGIYEDNVALASLVSSYATRAGKELPGLDAEGCAEQLRALRDAEAPSAAACGDASDLSLALGAAGPARPTLQRFVVSGATGFAPADATEGGVPSPPTLRAQLLDESGCGVQDGPPVVLPGPPAHDSRGSTGSTTVVVVEETVVVDERGAGEVSCGGSPHPEPEDEYTRGDGCASDSSSSSEADSSDGCSGDSSTTSDSNDSCSGDSSTTSDSNDSCSGDSSTTSDSSDSGCASDSSSSSDDDGSSCSGSSDTSYDGDTCTGAAAPGAERVEKARAGLSTRQEVRRPRRFKVSLWSMALATVILPIRRRKRAPFGRG